MKLRDLRTGLCFTQECCVLISAVGGVVNPRGLDIPGIESFRGRLLHTARWMPDIEINDKDISVIGNGGKYASL